MSSSNSLISLEESLPEAKLQAAQLQQLLVIVSSKSLGSVPLAVATNSQTTKPTDDQSLSDNSAQEIEMQDKLQELARIAELLITRIDIASRRNQSQLKLIDRIRAGDNRRKCHTWDSTVKTLDERPRPKTTTCCFSKYRDDPGSPPYGNCYIPPDESETTAGCCSKKKALNPRGLPPCSEVQSIISDRSFCSDVQCTCRTQPVLKVTSLQQSTKSRERNMVVKCDEVQCVEKDVDGFAFVEMGQLNYGDTAKVNCRNRPNEPVKCQARGKRQMAPIRDLRHNKSTTSKGKCPCEVPSKSRSVGSNTSSRHRLAQMNRLKEKSKKPPTCSCYPTCTHHAKMQATKSDPCKKSSSTSRPPTKGIRHPCRCGIDNNYYSKSKMHNCLCEPPPQFDGSGHKIYRVDDPLPPRIKKQHASHKGTCSPKSNKQHRPPSVQPKQLCKKQPQRCPSVASRVKSDTRICYCGRDYCKRSAKYLACKRPPICGPQQCRPQKRRDPPVPSKCIYTQQQQIWRVCSVPSKTASCVSKATTESESRVATCCMSRQKKPSSNAQPKKTNQDLRSGGNCQPMEKPAENNSCLSKRKKPPADARAIETNQCRRSGGSSQPVEKHVDNTCCLSRGRKPPADTRAMETNQCRRSGGSNQPKEKRVDDFCCHSNYPRNERTNKQKSKSTGRADCRRYEQHYRCSDEDSDTDYCAEQEYVERVRGGYANCQEHRSRYHSDCNHTHRNETLSEGHAPQNELKKSGQSKHCRKSQVESTEVEPAQKKSCPHAQNRHQSK